MWKLRPERGRGLPETTEQAKGKLRLEPGSPAPESGVFSADPSSLWLHASASLTPSLHPSLPSPTPDEFGNEFEVNNCSICYHWVTAKPQGPAVFSADYKGCHVLEKVGSTHCSGSGGGRQGDLQLGASLA